ncbi:hypothetical protein ACH5RR_009005 [Cinchona calisaya]|uniref:Exocyst subunit Exo70 family protein n=1 Tax=Cinchona calisaya TaxID=153742 RepID=A0ABD3AI17_9GENT
MEDIESETTANETEQHMIAAAYHIVKAIGASKNLDNEMKRILSDLDIHLSKMTSIDENEADMTRETEKRLKFAEKKIMSFHSRNLKIWESFGPGEDYGYLQAVDEVQRLAESLENTSSNKKTLKVKQIQDEAENILQKAMEKLQEELVHILSKNLLPIQHEYLLVESCPVTVVEEESSMVSNEDESFEFPSQMERRRTECEQYIVDLIHPNAIPLIKCIAELMFASHYDQEFSQTFIIFWRQALDDYLINLNVKQLSIEDVLKMDWKCLTYRIRNWCHATRSVIGYLASGKRLFDRIMGEFRSTSSSCFVEASKGSVLCLLNFGQAVIIGPRRPERLFCLLDMYEVLSKLVTRLDDLFAGEASSLVKTEFHELLKRLGDSAKGIFLEFGNHVTWNTSTIPFTSGGITHLTKYVMNYIILLVEYGDTLNSLLEEQHIDNPGQFSNADIDPYSISPVAHNLQSVTSVLEANLDAKSDLYREESLKHIFMMNNIHYMVRKIENSKLRCYFGDEWIRRHVRKFRQHATSYERIAWGSILSQLKDDGSKGKAMLKDKCRKFITDFEEVYKSQTGWRIPDIQLREELKISASQRVIHAYRPFAARLRTGCISDKYIKYTEDDLWNYIWDLFEGSPKSLNHPKRR